MDPIGSAAIDLGTEIVKAACRLWFREAGRPVDSTTVGDLFAQRISDAIERRRITGMFEGFADTVAEKARQLQDDKAPTLLADERATVLDAVAAAFRFAP